MKKKLIFLVSFITILVFETQAQSIAIPTPYTIVPVAPPITGPVAFINPQTLTNVVQSGSPANNYTYTSASGGAVVSNSNWAPGVPFTILYTDPGVTGGMPIGPGATNSSAGSFGDFVGSVFGGFSGVGNFGKFVGHDNAGNFFNDDGAFVTSSTSCQAKIVYDGTLLSISVSYDGGVTFRLIRDGGTPMTPYPIASTTYFLKMWGSSNPQENDNVKTLPGVN